MKLRARVITCSDAAASGEREDRSGPAVATLLATHGYEVIGVSVVPDDIDAIAETIINAVDGEGNHLVVTTGGTGIAPRDVTPEATMRVAEKRIDGFGELMRAASLTKTPMAPLARSQAAVRGSALIINVPGSPAGATESLTAVLQLIPHAIELLSGKVIEKHPLQDVK